MARPRAHQRPSSWEGNIRNWNKILLWSHFIAGLSISYYFFFMPADGWSDGVNTVYKTAIIGFVFWTGVIRWNLPRIRRWSKRRTARA